MERGGFVFDMLGHKLISVTVSFFYRLGNRKQARTIQDEFLKTLTK
jgi:hypothetical protein